MNPRLALGSLLAVQMLLTACGADPAAPPERAPSPVEVESVRAVTLEETVRGLGSLRASEQVDLRAEVASRIRAVHFREGHAVAEGDLLFELDDDKLRRQRDARAAALRSAEVRLRDAARQLARQQELRQRNLSSEESLEQAQAEHEGAEAERDRLAAELALTERQLADTRIHAPFSGVVSERGVDRGAFVGVGERLATLYQVAPLEVRFSVPERHLGRLRIGQQARLGLASWPDETFEGRVSFISPTVDETTRNLSLKAQVPNEDGRLRPGAFATVEVTLARRADVPTVSAESLVATRQGYMVFVVENGRAHGREVETGLRQGGLVEIRRGADVGALVVRSGHIRLDDGDSVRLVHGDANGIAP